MRPSWKDDYPLYLLQSFFNLSLKRGAVKIEHNSSG